MEKEVKITIKSQEDINKLVQYLEYSTGAKAEIEVQDNVYYSNEYLTLSKIALRVRLLPDRQLISIKSKTTNTDGYFQSNEENYNHTNLTLDVFEKDFCKILQNTSLQQHVDNKQITNLQKHVHMKTKRTKITFQEFNFEIDQVDILHPSIKSIFEIECETIQPEQYKALITNILTQLGINYEYSKLCKMEVALQQ